MMHPQPHQSKKLNLSYVLLPVRFTCTSCRGCSTTTTGTFTSTWSSRRSDPACTPPPGSSPPSPRTSPSALWPESSVMCVCVCVCVCVCIYIYTHIQCMYIHSFKYLNVFLSYTHSHSFLTDVFMPNFLHCAQSVNQTLWLLAFIWA